MVRELSSSTRRGDRLFVEGTRIFLGGLRGDQIFSPGLSGYLNFKGPRGGPEFFSRGETRIFM